MSAAPLLLLLLLPLASSTQPAHAHAHTLHFFDAHTLLPSQNTEKVSLQPLLIRKGTTRVALYGLGTHA